MIISSGVWSVCVYVCVFTYMYLYAYMHTNTHICICTCLYISLKYITIEKFRRQANELKMSKVQELIKILIKSRLLKPLVQQSQTFCHQGPVSWKTIFPWTGEKGMVSGWFKHIIFIVYFISVIIVSAPLEIMRHQIPKAGDPCSMDIT